MYTFTLSQWPEKLKRNRGPKLLLEGAQKPQVVVIMEGTQIGHKPKVTDPLNPPGAQREPKIGYQENVNLQDLHKCKSV